MVPFTQRWSKSFLMKMICAPGFSTSSLEVGAVAGVEQLQFGGADGVVADVVQHVDEDFVRLPVHRLQFDGDEVYLAEYPCREEVGSGVEAVQYLAFIPLYDGFQLENVAHKQDLLTAERFAQVAGVDAENAVYGVDDVGAYHGNLVNDDQLQFFEQFAMGLGVLEELVDASPLQAEVGIIG